MKISKAAMLTLLAANARAFSLTTTTCASTGIRSLRHHVVEQHNNIVTALSMSTSTSTTDATESNPVETKAKTVQKKRILSGVQPTGTIHLGNYLGAIRQWVDLQNSEEEQGNESLFCVVDLHAITQPQVPEELGESTLMSAAIYLAAGIDPQKSKVFVQSHVPAHSELGWLLNCITPMNWLERMIQYKDKAKKITDGGSESSGVGVGLFGYPVLMAADIILYGATHVPVGEDQRQHLELCRDLVRRFNDNYCKGKIFI